MPGMAHHHHKEEAVGAEKLGDVHFPVSCAAAQQQAFNRGIALLHSFGYTNAEAQYRAIAKADPTCAMAHWGIAMTQYHALWSRPDAAELKTGAEEMAQARELAAAHPVTPREQEYIAALSDFYEQAPQDYIQGIDAYTAKMAKLHADFPNDIEGAAFYALALLADVAPNDTSLAKEHRALAVLLPLFKQYPEHPGLAHYIIHTCDTPSLAQDGLEAAKVYARIAPSSPHALHMPGHIFARLGLWQEDIDSNLASVRASEMDDHMHIPGIAHQMHADEFLIYAYLQTGQDEKAHVLTTRMAPLGARMAAMPMMDDMKDDGAFFANELNVIYLMEMHDWKALSNVQAQPNSPPEQSFEIPWGRGVAAGHLKNAAIADQAIVDYEKFEKAVKATGDTYFVSIVLTQHDELLGWQAYAHGNTDAALASMRAAATQQDKLGQAEVDIPADEMVGDLLVLLGRKEEALAAYKLALHYSPNRLNTLLDAGEMAEALGRKAEAASFYAQAAHNTSGSATRRADVAHAVAFSKANPIDTKASMQ
ncbi:hypothetical protein SAMN05421819_3265 [Bryocella elongata]|uniref:Uncharacterized protein n=1 Tax=Bryocella elongata TaxID=863522 RepID=A0A1H6AP60_9BACT|nr:hypothetical protein [Bryocella elongata]SEG49980.1 hypothetical protein SAMN05421819_3265 [Bryocella elongata]